jgi:hypothetical protein
MINYNITSENPESIKSRKAKLSAAFPDRDPDKMYNILHLYDEAYLSAKEYFSYYFPMTTETVVKYINDSGLGRIWQFITDAIFDEGINALFSLIDKRSSKYRNILERSEELFGFPISSYSQSEEYIKRIRIYRNHRSAHFGDNYFEENSSIGYDDPVIMLENLRRDRKDFNQKYLDLEDLSYDELKNDFTRNIPYLIKMLDAPLDGRQIRRELIEYLDAVVKEKI